MKKASRFLVMGLIVIMLASAFGVPTHAANVDDYPFYNFTMYIWQRFLNPRVKEDDSRCYLYITEATHPSRIIHISANGCNVNGENRENCTWNAQGVSVSSVKVWYGQDFSIRNEIYENGYTYCTLGFRIDPFQGNEISGVWSPDTAYPHQIATD